MSDWKKVEMGNVWNYKEEGKGSELIGLYTGKEEHVGENDSNVYSFEIEGGEVVTVWGTTLLDMRFKNLKVGEEVKVVYLGAVPSPKRKGKTYHNFDVYHRMPEFGKIEEEGESSEISEEEISL